MQTELHPSRTFFEWSVDDYRDRSASASGAGARDAEHAGPHLALDVDQRSRAA